MRGKRIVIEIISADVAGILNRLNHSDVTILDTNLIDELTVQITVVRKAVPVIRSVLAKESVHYKVISPYSAGKLIDTILHRPLLWVGVCTMIILTLYLQGRVLFVRVEGNKTVPTNMIIDSAKQCGIAFGSSVADLRNEKVKNELLQNIEALKWIGIETRGCVVTIHVQEDDVTEETHDPISDGSHIVSVCDGLITDINATSGQLQCKIGQAVLKGQVLISGYTDYGKVVKYSHAEGEIYAQTRHEMELFAPDDYQYRTDSVNTTTRYSVKIGNKLINFSSNSGISPADCVKIYEEHPWVLPGGYLLPVTLVVETWTSYETNAFASADTSDHGWIKNVAHDYLHKKMIAGTVIMEEFDFTCSTFGCRMVAQYLCEEMIGRSVDLPSER